MGTLLTDDNRLLIPERLLKDIHNQLKIFSISEKKGKGFDGISAYLTNYYADVLKNADERLFERCEFAGIGVSAGNIERAIKGKKGKIAPEIKYELLDFLCFVCMREKLYKCAFKDKYQDTPTIYSIDVPEKYRLEIREYLNSHPKVLQYEQEGGRAVAPRVASSSDDDKTNTVINKEEIEETGTTDQNTTDASDDENEARHNNISGNKLGTESGPSEPLGTHHKIRNRIILVSSITFSIFVVVIGVTHYQYSAKKTYPNGTGAFKAKDLGIIITDFDKTDDSGFSDHVQYLLSGQISKNDTIESRRIAKFINISDPGFHDTIVKAFNDWSYAGGILLFGRRIPNSRLLDCNLFMFKWHGIDSLLQNNNIIQIQNPDVINFSIDNQAEVVTKFILGLIFYHASNIASSNNMFQFALDSDKNEKNYKFKSYCYFFIGNNYFKQRNYSKAIEKYKNGLQLDSTDAYLHFNLAIALLSIDSSRANDEFNKANRLEAQLKNPITASFKITSSSGSRPKNSFTGNQLNAYYGFGGARHDTFGQYELPSTTDGNENKTLEKLLSTTISEKTDRMINECILNGADPNIQSRKTGWSPLHIAAVMNDTILAKNILKYRGIKVNARDSVRTATPLWYAAKKNSYKVAELLLKYGSVRVDAYEMHGSPWNWQYSTALDVATDPKLVDLLLQYNAHKFEQLSK